MGLFKDPYVKKYLKIFLVSFVCWFLLTSISLYPRPDAVVYQNGTWVITYRVMLFGFPIFTFRDYYGFSRTLTDILKIPTFLSYVIAIASLVLILFMYAIPDIKKKWSSI